MKKVILSLVVLCFALTAMAEPVGRQAALYTAQSYMLAKGKTINTVQKPFKARSNGAVSQTEDEEAYYYVFNAGNDRGYVIVSGDDRTEPILGNPNLVQNPGY